MMHKSKIVSIVALLLFLFVFLLQSASFVGKKIGLLVVTTGIYSKTKLS